MGIKNEPITNSAYQSHEVERISKLFGYFDGYLEQQDNFEYFYSKKRGVFFRVSVKDELSGERDGVVLSSDRLFEVLVTEICTDVEEPRIANQVGGIDSILPLELAEARRRIEAIIEGMDENDRAYYTELMESCLKRIENE